MSFEKSARKIIHSQYGKNLNPIADMAFNQSRLDVN